MPYCEEGGSGSGPGAGDPRPPHCPRPSRGTALGLTGARRPPGPAGPALAEPCPAGPGAGQRPWPRSGCGCCPQPGTLTTPARLSALHRDRGFSGCGVPLEHRPGCSSPACSRLPPASLQASGHHAEPCQQVPGAGGGTPGAAPGGRSWPKKGRQAPRPSCPCMARPFWAINNPAASCQTRLPSSQGGAAPRCLLPPRQTPLPGAQGSCPGPLHAPSGALCCREEAGGGKRGGIQRWPS